MFISIAYDSKWNNSFLGDKDAKGNRPFLGTTKKSKEEANYRERPISLYTVYGILYRLLGARAPLEELLKNDQSILSKLIKKSAIKFQDRITCSNEEVVYLRNGTRSEDKTGWSGIPDNTIFSHPNVIEACSVLFYTREQMINYILKGEWVNLEIDASKLNAVAVGQMLEQYYKDPEMIITEDEFERVSEAVTLFSDQPCSQTAKLGLLAINKAIFEADIPENLHIFLSSTGSGTFRGVSLNGHSFTIKDFMAQFSNKKYQYGSPYKPSFFTWDEKLGKKKKVDKQLIKSSGILDIEIDCSLVEAEEIEALIESAGTSSFYVGKKGLGYVDQVII